MRRRIHLIIISAAIIHNACLHTSPACHISGKMMQKYVREILRGFHRLFILSLIHGHETRARGREFLERGHAARSLCLFRIQRDGRADEQTVTLLRCQLKTPPATRRSFDIEEVLSAMPLVARFIKRRDDSRNFIKWR